MLFSELYKIMVNKVTFIGFRGGDVPIAPSWIRLCMRVPSRGNHPGSKISGVHNSVANLAVFPRIWACFFCGVAGFLKTCRLLVFGLVLIEISLFFGLVFCRFLLCGLFFFSNFYGIFTVAIYCERHIGRVFVKICSFWACFFGFATMIFYLIFLLIFRLVEFSCQRILGLFFG